MLYGITDREEAIIDREMRKRRHIREILEGLREAGYGVTVLP